MRYRERPGPSENQATRRSDCSNSLHNRGVNMITILSPASRSRLLGIMFHIYFGSSERMLLITKIPYLMKISPKQV